MLLSLYMRPLNDVHLARPMVCEPATQDELLYPNQCVGYIYIYIYKPSFFSFSFILFFWLVFMALLTVVLIVHTETNKLPERATMFLNESPCTAKLETRALRLKVGGGRNVLAAVLLAVSESLLPSSTSQLGPPNCKRKTSPAFKLYQFL